MRRLTSVLLAVVLSVATVAIAWASASAVGPLAGGMAEAHRHATAAPGAPERRDASAAFAVHHGHPDGATTEDCAAMALGCAGLVAHAAVETAPALGMASARRGTLRDEVGRGTSLRLPDRPPRA